MGISVLKTKKNSQSHTGVKFTVVMLLAMAMVSVVVYGTGVMAPSASSDGLSGLVSVKGTVNVDALNLSTSEISRINRVVDEHSDMFTKIDVYLDAKTKEIDGNTVLVMALVLDTNGDCEVRSWSRKISRQDLVSQLVRYMGKAAGEYEQFKKYPDVKQNFKCLYI